MKRKAYSELLRWKNNSKGHTAILIDGARRTGKTYLVTEFAKNEYRSHVIIDCSVMSRTIRESFEMDGNDLDLIFKKITVEYNVKLHPRESVIVFDEIQMFPRAREMIKHLVKDGRYDYIETGSLLSIGMNVKDIVIPSEERHLVLHPMDFEEFMWAMGEEPSMESLRWFYENRQPLGDGAHHRMMNLFRQYMLVGGMPQSVEEYVEKGDFESVEETKRDILDLYRQDVSKFATGYEMTVRSIFDGIPSSLNTKDKIFRIGSIDKRPDERDANDAFLWLTDAGVASACFNATDPTAGLSMYTDRASVKLYMADTGLLVTHTISETNMDARELYRDLLMDRLNVNEGMFAENAVAQMLSASGHRLYFYRRSNPNDRQNEMEIDFLVMIGGKICPVEVKSSPNTKHTSLDKFVNRFGKRIGQPYILCTKDLSEKDGILFLPIYMACLL